MNAWNTRVNATPDLVQEVPWDKQHPELRGLPPEQRPSVLGQQRTPDREGLIEKLEAAISRFDGHPWLQYDKAIAIIRQHEAEHVIGYGVGDVLTDADLRRKARVPPSEISDIALMELAETILHIAATKPCGQKRKSIVAAIRPYLRTTERGVFVDDGNGGVRPERIPEPVSSNPEKISECPMCKRDTPYKYYQCWNVSIDCKGCGFHDIHSILGEPHVD